MIVHDNVPQYIVSALESECDRLGVPKSFVLELNVFPKNYYKDGKCLPVTKDRKLIGVAIDIRECDNKSKTKGIVSHEAKHTEQYYRKGKEYVEDTNPVTTELEAMLYVFKRSLEEKIKNLKSYVCPSQPLSHSGYPSTC